MNLNRDHLSQNSEEQRRCQKWPKMEGLDIVQCPGRNVLQLLVFRRPDFPPFPEKTRSIIEVLEAERATSFCDWFGEPVDIEDYRAYHDSISISIRPSDRGLIKA